MCHLPILAYNFLQRFCGPPYPIIMASLSRTSPGPLHSPTTKITRTSVPSCPRLHPSWSPSSSKITFVKHFSSSNKGLISAHLQSKRDVDSKITIRAERVYHLVGRIHVSRECSTWQAIARTSSSRSSRPAWSSSPCWARPTRV